MAGSKSTTGRGVQGKPGRRYELPDEAWQRIEPLLPKQSRGGRWNDYRNTLNGIFWILNCGAQWRDMPERYGKWQHVRPLSTLDAGRIVRPHSSSPAP